MRNKVKPFKSLMAKRNNKKRKIIYSWNYQIWGNGTKIKMNPN